MRGVDSSGKRCFYASFYVAPLSCKFLLALLTLEVYSCLLTSPGFSGVSAKSSSMRPAAQSGNPLEDHQFLEQGIYG